METIWGLLSSWMGKTVRLSLILIEIVHLMISQRLLILLTDMKEQIETILLQIFAGFYCSFSVFPGKKLESWQFIVIVVFLDWRHWVECYFRLKWRKSKRSWPSNAPSPPPAPPPHMHMPTCKPTHSTNSKRSACSTEQKGEVTVCLVMPAPRTLWHRACCRLFCQGWLPRMLGHVEHDVSPRCASWVTLSLQWRGDPTVIQSDKIPPTKVYFQLKEVVKKERTVYRFILYLYNLNISSLELMRPP